MDFLGLEVYWMINGSLSNGERKGEGLTKNLTMNGCANLKAVTPKSVMGLGQLSLELQDAAEAVHFIFFQLD